MTVAIDNAGATPAASNAADRAADKTMLHLLPWLLLMAAAHARLFPRSRHRSFPWTIARCDTPTAVWLSRIACCPTTPGNITASAAR